MIRAGSFVKKQAEIGGCENFLVINVQNYRETLRKLLTIGLKSSTIFPKTDCSARAVITEVNYVKIIKENGNPDCGFRGYARFGGVFTADSG